MKKIGLTFIILLSFSFIFSGIYFNYILAKIYTVDFKEYEKVEVFDKFNYSKEKFYYGNKLKNKKITYKVKGKINNKKLGKYKISYEAKYKKSTFSTRKEVEVVDTKKPKLIIDGVFSNVCKNGKASNVKVSATDNYDGDLTDKIEYKIEDNVLTYKVEDSSGNKTIKSFNVNVLDNEKPTIMLDGDSTVYIGVGDKYKEKGYSAVDNCDGDITNKVVVENNVNTNKSGDYEITYKVSDESNNTTTIKRKVKVFNKNNYVPGQTTGKIIYLTFDDGPGPDTARLLDILAKYNVKATFFVTGYNSNYDNIIKREKDEGHTVALHSYTHRYEQIYTSLDAYMNDLLLIQDKVKKITGEESHIIRFPGGSSNTISRRYKHGVMTEIASTVESIGFRYFDWTIASGDAGETTNTNVVFQNVTRGLREDRPNVVLQHDIKGFSVNAVEDIIIYGLANGYSFAPLTMESPVVHQGINN